MTYTRRDFGKLALAAAPLAGLRAAAPIDSKFHGVQIGAITYSFNSIANPDPEAIIQKVQACICLVEAGLAERARCVGQAGGSGIDLEWGGGRREIALA
jgi:hypothetical protein